MFVVEVESNNVYNIFEGSVRGDGGEQTGVGPVELFLWLLIPVAEIALSEELSVLGEEAFAISKEQGFFVTAVSLRSHRKFLLPGGNISRKTDGTISIVHFIVG